MPLAAEYGDSCDSIVVNGLIGTNILQYINFLISKCMNGSALWVDTGFIPFGNAEYFLYQNQLSKTGNCRIEKNVKTIVSQVRRPNSLVNSCLEPKATFEDDLAPLFDDSSVENVFC